VSETTAGFFDFGGVVIKNTFSAKKELAHKLNLTAKVIESIWDNQMPLLRTNQIDEAEFWSQLHINYDVRQVDVEENLLGKGFAESLTPNTEVIDVIKKLGRKGLTRAVLSNTIEPHASVLRRSGLYDDFDDVILSCEVEMAKPDTAIFEYALDRLKVRPNEVFFVDDIPKNVTVAKSLGMHGLVFTSAAQLKTDLQELGINDL